MKVADMFASLTLKLEISPELKAALESMGWRPPDESAPAFKVCGREAQTAGYMPCTRYTGHGGPCAHALVDVEMGWLIEAGHPSTKGRGGCPRWWAGMHQWTEDSLKAVRFARKQDAELVLNNPDFGYLCCFATEHQWG